MAAVGHYLFNFSRKGAAKGRTLRDQAAELLLVGLWGIGSKTPNRGSLAAGDRVLIYAGAPEYSFIGHAELESATHEWSPQEAARYPGSFDGGVALLNAEVWERPVPMKTVLPELDLNESNPSAHFLFRGDSDHATGLRNRRRRRDWPFALDVHCGSGARTPETVRRLRSRQSRGGRKSS